jgi:hypothetical protein
VFAIATFWLEGVAVILRSCALIEPTYYFHYRTRDPTSVRNPMMTTEKEAQAAKLETNLGVAKKLAATQDPNHPTSSQDNDCSDIMTLENAYSNNAMAPNNNNKCNKAATIKHNTAKLSSQKLPTPPPHAPRKEKGRTKLVIMSIKIMEWVHIL